MSETRPALRPLDTSRAVWELLCNERGLQPRSWDKLLVAELRERLGLPSAGNIGRLLDEHAISIEAFVVAFFQVAEPFAQMWSDLLEFFEHHRVRATDEVVTIEFDFEAGRQSTRFSLDAFRAVGERWARARGRIAELPFDDTGAWWELWNALRESLETDAGRDLPDVDDDAARAWLAEYRERRWPAHPVPPPHTGWRELDALLERAWQVWDQTVRLTAPLCPHDPWAGPGSIRETSGALGRSPEASAEVWAQRVDALLRVNHDRWPESTLEALYRAARRVREAPPDTAATRARELQRALIGFFDAHPLRMRPGEILARELLDVLELPFWVRRYELYGAWILPEILSAIDYGSYELILPEPGVLRFPFKATPMARLQPSGLRVWSEVRGRLDNPVGKGRVAGVQPDYSVLTSDAQPEHATRASLLEVECKQYRRQSLSSFAAALTDYARARTSASIILVNHGQANDEKIRSRVPARLRARTNVVPHMHPGDQSAREDFQRLVQAALAPALRPPPAVIPSSEPSASAALVITLTWTAPPTDLDLHLRISQTDASHHIWYGDLGSAQTPPFATLSGDAMSGGTETIAVTQMLPAQYNIAVHAYSGDGPLAGCGARVTITTPEHTRRFACPERGSGQWWHVARLGPDGWEDVPSRLLDSPNDRN